MGYREAAEDGVRHAKSSGGNSEYYPLCHVCGNEVMSFNYVRGLSYTCKECKLSMALADKEIRESQDLNAKERKFRNAIDRIVKQGADMRRYEYATQAVHKKLHRAGWFDSTEEIMAAIELVRRNIKARHQVKMGRYKADFVLPDEKIVLEIDGTIYHTPETKKREIVRDDLIVLALGPNWDVVRVTDTLINENVSRLVPAIRAVKRRRNKLRAENGGIIPDWYSDRML